MESANIDLYSFYLFKTQKGVFNVAIYVAIWNIANHINSIKMNDFLILHMFTLDRDNTATPAARGEFRKMH